MIFYFSGTGNSLTIARQLAKFTTDALLVDMAQPWQSSQTIEAETIGFVFPVYAWGLPLIVEDFIHKLPPFPPHVHYVYALLTCGDDMAYTTTFYRKPFPRTDGDLMHAIPSKCATRMFVFLASTRIATRWYKRKIGNGKNNCHRLYKRY